MAFDSSEGWVILSPIEQSIKRKIEERGVPLKDWGIHIYRGILTGCNDAFIITGEQRAELLAACATEDERVRTDELIRPILRGRDIKRYGYEFVDLWLIYIPWHFPLHMNPNIQGASLEAEDAFRTEYPMIYNHLCKFKEQLSARNQSETGIRYEWYALQRYGSNYMDDFNKQKIVWADLSRSGNSFAFDNNGAIVLNTSYILTVPSSSQEMLLYFLGILNSRITMFYMNLISSKLDNTGWRWFKQFVEIVPIPQISIKGIEEIVYLVQHIIKNGYSTTLENEVNQQLYKILGITDEEIKVIERN